jgi:hypothetical protein
MKPDVIQSIYRAIDESESCDHRDELIRHTVCILAHPCNIPYLIDWASLGRSFADLGKVIVVFQVNVAKDVLLPQVSNDAIVVTRTVLGLIGPLCDFSSSFLVGASY